MLSLSALYTPNCLKGAGRRYDVTTNKKKWFGADQA